MRGLSGKETIGVAGVALAAVAVTWFSVAMTRSARDRELPQCTEVYSRVGGDVREAGARDSVPPDGLESPRRGKGTGEKKGRRKSKGAGKSVNKNKTRNDRSFLDEKL